MAEKVTIKVACKALNLSEKTIRRYLEDGRLTKVKEKGRVYIPADDIRSFKDGHGQLDDRPQRPIKDRLTIDRIHYDGLLTRLGQLEGERQYLLEYKAGLQRKEDELRETQLWMEESLKENKNIQVEKQKLEEEIISKNTVLSNKNYEIEELRKNLEKFQKQLECVKKRGLFKRIFNKD